MKATYQTISGKPFSEKTTVEFGTPREVIDTLHKALLSHYVEAADIKEQLSGLGAEPTATRPDDFARYIQAEIDKWALAVRLSGAKAD